MIDLNNNILALVEPAIQPLKLETPARGEDKGNDKITKTFGIDAPVIVLNNYVFERADLKTFNLSSSGIIPTVDINLVDTKNIFTVDSFPRDGDFFTIFINSKNQKTFKSIHLDFEITNISAEPSRPGDYKRVFISGRLKVPKVYAEACQYLENNTSLEHVIQVAKELGLGVASNIDQTNDTQTRIQPFINYIDFIKQIVNSSYISDDSFQTHFIDHYYYLNFINVNSIFNAKNPKIEEFQESFASMNVSLGEEGFADDNIDSTPSKLFLTNKVDFKPTNQYIGKYELINQSNLITETHGHFRDITIYDDNGDPKLDEYSISAPLKTDSKNLTDIQSSLINNQNSEYTKITKHKYMGRQNVGEDGLGNIHQNYLYAQIHNARNNDELQKLKLVVTLESFNPSLQRYQKVPVLIYNIESESISASLRLEEEKKKKGFKDSSIDLKRSVNEEQPDQVLDQFLSGYYLIESIDLIYKETIGKFYQTVTLIRREWPVRLSSIKSNK